MTEPQEGSHPDTIEDGKPIDLTGAHRRARTREDTAEQDILDTADPKAVKRAEDEAKAALIEAERSRLGGEFDGATAAEKPLETPIASPAPEAAAGLAKKFNPARNDSVIVSGDAAISSTPDGTIQFDKFGKPIIKSKVVGNVEGPGFLHMLGMLFKFLSQLLGPNKDHAILALNAMWPEVDRSDPIFAERSAKREEIREIIDNPDHPDRKLPVMAFAQKHVPGFADLNNIDFGALQAIKPELDALFEHILKYESRGNLNIVYDYRNKTEPEKSWPGFKPGDVTPGGLVVPEFNKLKVDEVLEWQRQYLEEQYAVLKADGTPAIPRGTGSSAVTALQWIYTTLKDMKGNYIKGDEYFTVDRQFQLGIQRMFSHREMGAFLAGNLSATDMFKNMGQEWEGLIHNPELFPEGSSRRAEEQARKDELIRILENIKSAAQREYPSGAPAGPKS